MYLACKHKSAAVGKKNQLTVPNNKENVEPDSSLPKKSLGAVPKQLKASSHKKARPRLVSIENIRIQDFQTQKSIKNLSPTIKSAGAFSETRFTLFNENFGTSVIATKPKEETKVTKKKTPEKDYLKATDVLNKKVPDDPSRKKSSRVTWCKTTPMKREEVPEFPEVFGDGEVAAGFSFPKTPAKSQPVVDDMSQKSRFRHVKHFFADFEEEKKSPQRVKRVLKRRMSDKIFENVSRFEEETKGTVKKTVFVLPAKRVQELKNEDVKLKETPEDTKFNLPPLENVKKVRLEKPKEERVKKPHVNPSFYSSASLEYVQDHLRFYESVESLRKSGSLFVRRVNVTSVQRKILVEHLINVNRHFNYPSFLTYNAVRLLDDVLSLQRNIPTEKLQLYELTSLWIILKKDHVFHRVPLSDKVCQFSDGAFSQKEVVACEREILSLMKFDISYPDIASMVNLCILSDPKLANLDVNDIFRMYYFSGYMIDVSLFDEDLMEESSILLASTIADLAVFLNLSTDTFSSVKDISDSVWTPSYGKCFPEIKRTRMRSMIVLQTIKSFQQGNMEHVVYLKYKRSRYGAVSKSLVLRLSTLSE